ncbi:MAG: 2-hydroxyacyl-CoA dehydratase family protein, partial [Desulfomonilia bacterium]|nr:2-hydroxyacyl-CoA dehydratase family protein [Desulfomonilia bacterium]
MEMREFSERIDNTLDLKRLEHESIELLSNLLTEFIQSPRVHNVVLSVFRNVLSAWSEGNRARRILSGIALRMADESGIHHSHPENGIDYKKVGRLITVGALHLNALQTQNPRYLADHIEEPLRAIIEHTDFGELKECLDRAEDPIVELVGRVMGFVWNTYPAKLGTIISMIHPLGNIIVRSLKEVLAPLNSVSPDLFTDLIFAIAKSIDGRKIGELANTVMDLARQIHTGSLLQGEAGVPQFQMDITEKLREIMSSLDTGLLVKVKIITAEMAEERENAISEIMDEGARTYHRQDFRGLISFVEEQTGKNLDCDLLREVIVETDKQDEIMCEIEDFMRLTPSPVPGIFNLFMYSAKYIYGGSREATEIMESMLKVS